MSGDSYNTLVDYQPPSWAQHLKPIPSQYVQLVTRPTPIHRWLLPGVPDGVQISVKRDDMTGSLLTGTKSRKFEFLLGEALQKGCDSVITYGDIQSNHCRTVAVAARQLGLQPHLVLRQIGEIASETNISCSDEIEPSAVGCTGNMLLDRCVGAKIMLVPPLKYIKTAETEGEKTLEDIGKEYSQVLRSQGSNPYVIPLGRYDKVGLWGYLEAFQELLEQKVAEDFDDVVLATGSGGTACGLALGNYLTGSKLRIHAVSVYDDGNYLRKNIDETLHALGLSTDSEGKPLHSRDIIDIIEGYKGRGYALSTPEELDQLLDIFSKTGVSVDPVYTLKGVRGMLSELTHNPGRFAGKRVLYLHTGGVFGLYADGRMNSLLLNNRTTNQIFSYKDVV